MNNFKKLVIVSSLLITAQVLCHATDVAYTGVFQGTEGPAKGVGVTTAKTYTRDMNTTGDRISMQIVYSSGSLTSQTFTDGSASTGSVTVASATYVLASTPTLKINGVKVVYVPVATSSGTAKAISDAIVANSSLNTIINSTWTSAGVVTTTAAVVGASTNYTLTSSSQAALTTSNSTMTGGTNSAYVVNTPTITITSNGFTTGLGVLYSKSSAEDITGLTDQTTYYVAIINPNTNGQSSTFKLSNTSTGAVAGVGIITLASSSTQTTADVFTLAPLGFTNAGGGIQLQWSDDNVTYFNATTGNYGASISSVTFSVGGGSVLYDLGPIQHRYLRLNEKAPTAGAATYTATDNERYSFKH